MKTQRLFGVALIVATFLLLQNCSSSDPAPATTEDVEYFGTQNPGDAWTAIFVSSQSKFLLSWDHGTSLITTDDVIFKGPYTKLANGYIKMQITEAVPAVPGIATDGSLIFYAVELPGKSLFIMPPASSKLGIITMNAKSTKTGSNGITNFNYVRTAFPTNGYEHVTKDECWGKIGFNFNESAGTFSLSSDDGKTLSCAEHDINSSISCQSESHDGIPLGTTLGTINSLGSLEQTFSIDTKKFRGQLTLGEGLIVMDSGEGSGGFFGVKENSSATIADFIGNTFIGFGSFFGRSESNTFFLSQSGVRLVTFATDSAALMYYNDIGTDNLQNVVSFGVKFKSMDKGLMKGYLWGLDSDGEVTNRFPFVATTYNKNGKKIMVMVSGRENAYPTATRGEQWVFELILTP